MTFLMEFLTKAMCNWIALTQAEAKTHTHIYTHISPVHSCVYFQVCANAIYYGIKFVFGKNSSKNNKLESDTRNFLSTLVEFIDN